MAKCDIKISLDKTDLTYETHDRVKCRFQVTVDKPVKCKGFIASILWRTHGKGNRNQKEMQETVLFEGNWEVGSYDYEHTFIIVDGPTTYHGKIVNVDWYIKATVDIPWAFDPKEEVDFIVRRRDKDRTSPHDAKELEFTGQKNGVELAKEFSGKMYKAYLGFAGVACLGGIYLLVSGVIQNLDIEKIIWGLGLLLMAYGFAWNPLKKAIAENKFGSIDFEIENATLYPGENCRVSFRFVAKRDILINGLALRLVGVETATSGSGTNETTYHEPLFTDKIDLDVPNIARAGRAVESSAEIAIPEAAPATFLASDNSVTWTLKAALDVEKWIDIEREQPITVR